MAGKINYIGVDTSTDGYLLKEQPFYSNYDAGAIFRNSIDKCYPNILKYEEVSKFIGISQVSVLLKVSFNFSGASNHFFYVYVCPIEGGGRFPKEQRIQFRKHSSWNPDLDTLKIANQFNEHDYLENKECYVIGIYKTSESDEDVIFSGLYPSAILNAETGSTSNQSIQIQIEGIQQAYIDDISYQDKSNNERIINFRPNKFFWYMKHRDELHLGDISKVNKEINLFKRNKNNKSTCEIMKYMKIYLSALRTKPFLLLAGISGTGKSRIVREFAFKSCPRGLRDGSMTTPGNYCMIEVKPNWHDSTELLGYWSNINNKYMFTKFVKFLVKAMQYPDVPFFVCLDEMNLAPVEQYFAEFLSVLETRQWEVDEYGNKHIVTGSLVDSEYFRKFEGKEVKMSDREWYEKLFDIKLDGEELEGDKTYRLYEEGLSLPENVFIVGTVNMDDTTHQFSRKVIDRAMTIEMNGGNLADIFMGKDDLVYVDNPMTMDDMKVKYLTAVDVVENCEVLKKRLDFRGYVTGENPLGDETLPKRLGEINDVLKGTPFTVSYRVMNELTIYLGVLLDEVAPTGDIDENVFIDTVNKAIDNILLMKILPRVEGDDEMFRLLDDELEKSGLDNENGSMGFEYSKLDWLKKIAVRSKMQEDGSEDGSKEKVYCSADKLDEMIERLHRQNFTRFWP